MDILTVANMYPSETDPTYGTFIKNFYEQLCARNKSGRNNLVVIKGRRKTPLSKLAAYIGYYSRLCLALLRSQHDIIYVHTVTFPIPAIRLISLFRKLSIVYNVHGDDVLPDNRFKRLLKRFARKAVPKARMVVCPSEYFKDVTLREFPGLDASKVIVSPSGGISRSFLSPKEQINAGNDLLLGYVSRIDNGKGWEIFLDALAQLPDCKGVIIGCGAEEENLQDRIKALGLDRRVQFLGAKSHTELPEFYSSFDLFVFPTMRRAESLGLVGLEAMGSGTPVVASNMAGPAGYVDDGRNGYLFTPGNAEELAKKIKCYLGLDKGQRTQMSEAAYTTALAYEAEDIADKLHDKIKSLINC